MGNIRSSYPVKFFVSVLTSIPSALKTAEERLEACYGPVELRSELFPFDQTHYYDREMGSPIRRVFLVFPGLISATRLPGRKIETNRLEQQIAAEYAQVPRPVNLDPGYLDQAKVVLASTKDFSHRLLVSEGIYAEVTLYFRGGEWRSWPWTFPDFRAGQFNGFFSQLRRTYREQLAAEGHRTREILPDSPA
jgi:hypothetical protein